MILMKFNESKSLTYSQIKTETQIQPENELKWHLFSLMKMKMIVKETPDEEIDVKPSDVLIINDSFNSRLIKFKAPLINTKDNQKKETQDITFKTEADRWNLLEATIVKIMKTWKWLEHNELISEVMRLVSNNFQPQASMIKQRIENLIEKEYICRDPSDVKFYQYVA